MTQLTRLVSWLLLFAFVAPEAATAQESETPAVPAPAGPDGWTLLEGGQAAEALDAFLRALATDPDSVPLQIGAGRAAILEADYTAAIQHLSRARELDPRSFDATFHLARAFAEQGRELFYSGRESDGGPLLEDAASLFEAAALLDTTAAAPLVEQAAIFMELGDPEAADGCAVAALERDAKCLQALLFRGDAAFYRFQAEAAAGSPADLVKEKWNEAMALYRQANAAAPEASGPFLGIATLFEADKKWEEASEAVMSALVLDPELIAGYDKLLAMFGSAETRERLAGLLATLLDRIADEYPRDRARAATPLYYRGFALLLNHDYEQAIESYSASMEANPEYRAGATYYIAKARFALNDYDQAARAFLQLIGKERDKFEYFAWNDPGWQDVAAALSFLSDRCYNAQDMKGARDLIAGILLLIKNNPNTYNNYAFLCRETGQYEEAYAAYRECLALDPKNPSVLNDTALMLQYHLHRDLDYAKELYRRAIAAAREILQDDQASAQAKEEAGVALRDATNNLGLLSRG